MTARHTSGMGILAALLVAGCPATHEIPDAPALDARSIPDSPDAPVCVAEACDGDDDDCDGVVDEETACTVYGAEARCAAGSCELVRCLAGFADCDGEPANGCERDVRSDREHCGACGFECAVTQTCERSTCRRERIADVAPGDRGTCVLLESGRVLCWGSNESGLFWDEPELDRSLVPREIPGLPTNGLAVEVGYAGYLVTSAGEVWSWGRNRAAELGRGSVGEAVIAPGPLSIPLPVRELAGRGSMLCALDDAGGVWCWGADVLGVSRQLTPIRVELPEATRDLGGSLGGSILSLTTAGIFVWGSATFGIRGSTPAPSAPLIPTLWPAVTGADQLFVNAIGCAALATGAITCWGSDVGGALGNGPPDDTFDPAHPIYYDPVETLVPPAPTDVAVIGSMENPGACALYSDGALWCWGAAPASGLGHDASTPEQLVLGGFGLPAAIVADRTACVVSEDRTRLMCWGENWFGELGNGSLDDSARPVPVVGFD